MLANLENNFNSKKIIIIVSIIIIIIVIALLSILLIVHNSNKKRNDLEVSSSKEIVQNVGKRKSVAVNKEENYENETYEDKDKDEIENNGNSDNIGSNDVETVIGTNLNHRLPVPNPNAIQYCKEAQSGDEKNIYLTFDDGPSPNITPEILKTLREYNVPATFFVLGSRAELYPDLIKKEFEEGHYIANHGYSHKYSSIYASVQTVLDEYNRTEEAIQNALGTTEFHSYLFRFPGGSSGGPYNDLKQEAKRTLESMGIASTNWNCLTGDAEGNGKSSKEQLLNRLYETAEGWNSLVVLMHDADDKRGTADALPELIEHYKNLGYTFKNYYEIFK